MRKLVPTLIGRAEAFQIASEDQYQEGSQVINYLSKQKKELKKLHKFQKDPIVEAGRRIDGFFKLLREPVEQAITIVKEKMGVWYRIQEEKRQKAEAEARKIEEERRKAEAERIRMLEEAEAGGEEIEEMMLPVVPPPAPIVPERPKATGTTVRKEWKFTIMDEKKIPRIYLMVDEKAIRQSIRDGVREIPGLKIYQETNIISKG